MRFRFGFSISAAALGALAASSATAGVIATFTPPIDGVREGAYGSAIAVQNANTGFGNATSGVIDTSGGELDALYLANDTGNLYVLSTGNLEDNFNGYYVFIDNVAEAGGDSGVFAGISGGDGIFGAGGIGGMTFPTGMNVDYILAIKIGQATGDPNIRDYRFQVANLVTNAVVLDSGGSPNLEFTAGGLGTDTSGSASFSGHDFALDNSNTAGVDGTPPDAATGGDPATVGTGIEISIPLSTIPGAPAPGSQLQIFTAYVSGDGSFFSNQTLPPIPVPQGNHATDPNYSSGGLNLTPASITLGTPPPPTLGTFFFESSISVSSVAPGALVATGLDTDSTGGLYFAVGNFSAAADSTLHYIADPIGAPASITPVATVAFGGAVGRGIQDVEVSPSNDNVLFASGDPGGAPATAPIIRRYNRSGLTWTEDAAFTTAVNGAGLVRLTGLAMASDATGEFLAASPTTGTGVNSLFLFDTSGTNLFPGGFAASISTFPRDFTFNPDNGDIYGIYNTGSNTAFVTVVATPGPRGSYTQVLNNLVTAGAGQGSIAVQGIDFSALTDTLIVREQVPTALGAVQILTVSGQGAGATATLEQTLTGDFGTGTALAGPGDVTLCDSLSPRRLFVSDSNNDRILVFAETQTTSVGEYELYR
ncbi:MAG: hypothetical protein HUU25_06055 [Candidatus Sumerlaeia bacterium]|nr:hypothetical protein [Candidatus Sumerlaeia bacterium]